MGMTHNYRPGDVAIFRTLGGDDLVVFRYRDINTGTDEWMSATEGGAYPLPGNLRPLVTIEPEDREAVERLMAVIPMRDRIEAVIRRSIDDHAFSRIADHFQAALREFANPAPPKPDEPTGLGAVVEAIYDNRFVHVGNGGWQRVEDGDRQGQICTYAEVAAVRVLSEGVTES